eukprot:516134-Rhodomonas_salina.1
MARIAVAMPVLTCAYAATRCQQRPQQGHSAYLGGGVQNLLGGGLKIKGSPSGLVHVRHVCLPWPMSSRTWVYERSSESVAITRPLGSSARWQRVCDVL